MKALPIAIAGAVVSVLAFPPVGPGWLVLVGVALFLVALRMAGARTPGAIVGAVYGLVFFGGLMWWLVELELIALVLVPVQALFYALFGWWLGRYGDRSPGVWLTLAVGGWSVMELFRQHMPVGGLEWGGAGYALSDHVLTRFPAATVGTTGLTVMVVCLAGLVALAARREWTAILWWPVGGLISLTLIAAIAFFARVPQTAELARVAVVQGSTPCPFEQCPPDERLRTFQQHLELTKGIESGSVDLVVWSEGSSGSTNADPVQNPEIGEAVAHEARRIGAWFLIGSDRPVSDTEWVNANVVFDPSGEVAGEYRKQHPVPFGEYVPLRAIFGLIPATRRVPRDMIPGEGPVVFDLGRYDLGSVISFEGGFSRYGLSTRRLGADVLVVATNESSYDYSPTSDQFIGMTRMRAVELGVSIIHAAVTGKSTIIDPSGDFYGTTELGASEIYEGTVTTDSTTFFTVIGNSVMWVTALAGILVWWRAQALVGSVYQLTTRRNSQ